MSDALILIVMGLVVLVVALLRDRRSTDVIGSAIGYSSTRTDSRERLR